jgi:peptidoglycan hydrolase-like protein with peptidoglycan-binding domain
MTSARDARIAGCAVVLLAGGVVANVAYLQDGQRERRRPVIPVGVHVPLPSEKTSSDVRRPSGPVTLSLASLLETSQADEMSALPAAQPAPQAPIAASRLSGIGQAIEQVTAPAQPAAQLQPQSADQGRDLVRDTQVALAALGYEPGPADGEIGLMTRAAILAFEFDHGLPATAEVGPATLSALKAPTRRATGFSRQAPSRAATGVIRAVQQHLIATGHLTGGANGQLDARTVTAIRSFESTSDLRPSGRVSAPLMARLQRAIPRRSTVASGQ